MLQVAEMEAQNSEDPTFVERVNQASDKLSASKFEDSSPGSVGGRVWYLMHSNLYCPPSTLFLALSCNTESD